ncbi:MerR family transcriptional regulator [Terribacillus saccharophilus]|uniref:MerR family transcriptional regulator n=1 Tax=Terribacillus saccharophilus TaxID=361277 RepID=UPI0039821EFD
MKNKLSIGEMAKLHNTTIKTLRYYDEIGLLKPVEVDPNNGYRYYSTEQFEQLNTIHYLKELGFSLKQIMRHLEHRDIDGFLNLLEKQKQLTEIKINELEQIKLRFQNRIEDINSARQLEDLGVPKIRFVKERKIVRLMYKITSEPELEISLKQLENLSQMTSSIFIGGVGLTVSIENLKDRKFDEYNSIFILYEEENQSTFGTTLSEGEYVCVSYNGSHSDSPLYYKAALDYIQNNGLQVNGDSIERTIINHYISEKEEDHLTEIQIPIKY